MATYDPRTGKKLKTGVTQDFSNYRGPLNYDTGTGRRFSSNQPITTNQLQPTTPLSLNKQPSQVPSSGLESAITGSINAYKTQSESDRLIDEQSKARSSSLESYMSQITGLDTEMANAKNIDRTVEDTARKDADRFTSEIEAEQLANRRKIEALQKNPQGMTAGAIADESNRLERESLSKQADLAILQNSALRNYTTAKDIADREVENKLEPLKLKQERLKMFYEENKDNIDTDFKYKLEQKIKEEDRAYEKEEKLQQTIMDLKLEGIKNGSLNRGDLDKLNKATSYENAFDIVLRSWKNTSNTEVPTVKTINGVDMQWNSSTGQWETIGVDGVDANQKSVDQLKFLRDSAARAISLAGASGKSGVSRFVGEALIGDTRFNRLENETDTLRTNMLTLMTDPAIKKFFGPQMTNNDVRLMTSAGTTLNPRSQSKKDMERELRRLDELFNRMQTAVNNGGLGGNTITAPDGTIIQIID